MSRRRRRPGADRPAAPSIPDILYPTLDLHGATEAEAVRRAESWLTERAAEGEPVVRIVTGRGMHSLGGAVLPGAVERLLERLRGRQVRSYERETGGGAYRIRLVKSPAAPAPERVPRAVTHRLDPALVKQAEEALAELGIEPTPPLIEAEVRRIVRERGSGSA